MKPIYLVHLGLLCACGLLATFLPEVPQAKTGGPINAGDTAWLLTASGLVLLMTPGLSFFYGGMVRKKNMISTMLQSMVALGVISVTWVAFGFSLCFGESIGGIIGNPMTYFMYRGVGMSTHPDFSPTIPFMLFSLFQLKFAIITPALISGAFAERVKFSSYLIFMFLFSIFVYAPLAHMTWHPDGLLRGWGVLDFAGGTVVHISAGMAALAGSIYLGPRKERLHEAGNIPYVILGTGLLWFGWFGFNAGSSLGANETATLAFLNTNTASAVAMLTWMFLECLQGKKASALGACIGAVVG
jgi:Amt family ammonium transporter